MRIEERRAKERVLISMWTSFKKSRLLINSCRLRHTVVGTHLLRWIRARSKSAKRPLIGQLQRESLRLLRLITDSALVKMPIRRQNDEVSLV